MKNAIEYRQHAQECRALAKQMKEGDQREQMLKVAATWDKLADEQEARARRHQPFRYVPPSPQPAPRLRP